MERERLDLLISKARLAGAAKVFVQAPEGLKTQLQEIGSALEKAGISAVLSCEPCYGACDMRDAEARRLGCELLLHIGHAGFGQMAAKPALPVIYEECPLEADPSNALGAGMKALEGFRRIGLATTAQYLYMLDSVKRLLESKGKLILIGNGSANGRAKYPGQVLGCDYAAATSIEGRVDTFIFIGTGRFHALGLAAAVGKPVLFLDLENNTLEDMSSEKERQERIRFASIEKAKGCKNFGILVSTKTGQANFKAAEAAKAKLESKGKSAWLLAMDAIAPEKLLGLKLDCLVNCACPRLAEDAAQFRKPVIRPEDVERL